MVVAGHVLVDRLFIALPSCIDTLAFFFLFYFNRTQLARMAEMSLADVDLIISNYENMETIFR